MRNKVYIIIAVLLLLVAGLAGWIVTRHYLADEKPPVTLVADADTEAKAETVAGEGSGDAVSVRMFVPLEGGGIAVEEITVPNSPAPVKMAETVVAEYFKRSKKGLADTKVLGAYRDRRNILYLDLSDDIRRKFSGDARQEFALLLSLFDTVTANVMGVEDVRILIEGRETESIGGHFTLLAPLRETLKAEGE